ncbi:hypothetical protein J8Z82_21000 [Yersinia enterocolitica]|nr:hypothetical protein [Yersinia enterocolitica]MBX9494208.1 hypothetical protein [Yersinia enterocolitica]
MRRRTFFETLWNTGTRPNEALSLTPNKIAKYSEDQDMVTTINVERAVPVMDSNYWEHLHKLIAIFSITKDNELWLELPDIISR